MSRSMDALHDAAEAVDTKEIKGLAAELTAEQLQEAEYVFNLFDVDGKGEIGKKELNFALGKLGQHPEPEEIEAMIAEFDHDGNGTIDFEEFLKMMDILGWNDHEILSASELKAMSVSYYGQACICRWLSDGNSTDGDVLANIGSVTKVCRRVAMSRAFENLIYLCIFVAAIISGMQSYTIDSPFEHAPWAVVTDLLILLIFTVEIGMKVMAEDNRYPHHFFWDNWNTFDFVVCTMLIITNLARMGNQVAPFRLIRMLRAVRLLRTIRLFPNLQIVVETAVRSASSVVFIFLFLLLFSYMFAIVGVASFGRNDPFYFGNLGRALLTLFRTISMDSWSYVMYNNIYGCGQPDYDGHGNSRGYSDYKGETGMDCAHEPTGLFAAAYFVLYLCFGGFLILNLFIGIITTEMQTAKTEVMRQRAVSEKLALAAALRLHNQRQQRTPPSSPEQPVVCETNPTFQAFDADIEAANFDDEK